MMDRWGLCTEGYERCGYERLCHSSCCTEYGMIGKDGVFRGRG